MNPFFRTLGFATCLSIAMAGSWNSAIAQPTSSTSCASHTFPNQTRSESTVRALDLAWGKAWDAGDIAFIQCLYDPSWHYLTPKGITDKAQDIAAAIRHHAKYPLGNRNATHILNVTAFVTGNFAVSTGLYQFQQAGKTKSGRWSDSFMWDGSQWHSVFSQATPIA